MYSNKVCPFNGGSLSTVGTLRAREFFRDAQEQMVVWHEPNNKVGYFYLAGKSSTPFSGR